MAASIRVGVLGASGYTGAELVRILARHPETRIDLLTADRMAGKMLAEIYPNLMDLDLPRMIRIDDADWSALDLVFCALPHGTTQEVIAALPSNVKIVDLSADFRLADPEIYAQWYGHAHRAVELQKNAVYGLTELAREEVRGARLVANPGCYPTSVQLPLVPLLRAGLIDLADIIVDAKSGVSGAGRAAKEANLYVEIAEGIHAYGVASHRHAPEIEQGLSRAAGASVTVNFTPHLMPMSRGILSTIYVRLSGQATADELRAELSGFYESEPFVRVLPAGQSPATRYVRGSNQCHIGVFPDRIPGRAIVVAAIDNLVKGASGQAVQNMNVMFGLPEATALTEVALFP